jgi:DNA-binding NarL/FixJ family response regulator
VEAESALALMWRTAVSPTIKTMNKTAHHIRILIADDNAATRAATVALLESSAHQVAIWQAADGEEAVQLAKSVQPDIILMDVQMPKLDGIQATQRIKACRPAIKVIVLTMYVTYRAAALAAGADAFYLKGGSADGLMTAVFSNY